MDEEKQPRNSPLGEATQVMEKLYGAAKDRYEKASAALEYAERDRHRAGVELERISAAMEALTHEQGVTTEAVREFHAPRGMWEER